MIGDLGLGIGHCRLYIENYFSHSHAEEGSSRYIIKLSTTAAYTTKNKTAA